MNQDGRVVGNVTSPHTASVLFFVVSYLFAGMLLSHLRLTVGRSMLAEAVTVCMSIGQGAQGGGGSGSRECELEAKPELRLGLPLACSAAATAAHAPAHGPGAHQRWKWWQQWSQAKAWMRMETAAAVAK